MVGRTEGGKLQIEKINVQNKTKVLTPIKKHDILIDFLVKIWYNLDIKSLYSL
ncbi:MAG: hypothetical protein FWC79_01570 [Oscillospiraceae bacterium]|nr:hypothetical protein [Oscillospiraceae bacterium]